MRSIETREKKEETRKKRRGRGQGKGELGVKSSRACLQSNEAAYHCIDGEVVSFQYGGYELVCIHVTRQ